MAFPAFQDKWTRSLCERCRHPFIHKRKVVRRWCSKRCAALARHLGQQGTRALKAYHQPRRRDGQVQPHP